MARRTPLEVFINAQTDRQAAYEKRRREQGLTKACAWVPTELAPDWKDLARMLSKHHAGDLPDMRDQFADLMRRMREAEKAFERLLVSGPSAPVR